MPKIVYKCRKLKLVSPLFPNICELIAQSIIKLLLNYSSLMFNIKIIYRGNLKCLMRTYIHNWSLQLFCQNYNLAAHIT